MRKRGLLTSANIIIFLLAVTLTANANEDAIAAAKGDITCNDLIDKFRATADQTEFFPIRFDQSQTGVTVSSGCGIITVRTKDFIVRLSNEGDFIDKTPTALGFPDVRMAVILGETPWGILESEARRKLTASLAVATVKIEEAALMDAIAEFDGLGRGLGPQNSSLFLTDEISNFISRKTTFFSQQDFESSISAFRSEARRRTRILEFNNTQILNRLTRTEPFKNSVEPGPAEVFGEEWGGYFGSAWVANALLLGATTIPYPATPYVAATIALPATELGIKYGKKYYGIKGRYYDETGNFANFPNFVSGKPPMPNKSMLNLMIETFDKIFEKK